MKDTIVGVDLAKNVFQLHGASMTGEIKFRRKLARGQFLRFMASQSPALVAMEACGSAHYWARELVALGHEVKLIAPQYVRPFVKRQKNDMADAEAIAIATRQPEMRFVEPKTPEQQARAVLFRARERIVHQRTELVNALRAVLYEYGQVVPLGIGHVKRIEQMIEDDSIDLPEIVREECRDLLTQINEQTVRIEQKMKKLTTLSQQSDAARRLQTRYRPNDSACRRGVCPGDGKLPLRTGLCGVARTCSPTVLVWRQGEARLCLKSRSGRYSAASYYWCHGAGELGQPQAPSSRKLAGANAGQEAKNAGGHCTGEQDGPEDMGHVDEARRLSRFGGGCSGVSRLPKADKGRVRSHRPEWANDRTDPDRENQFVPLSVSTRN